MFETYEKLWQSLQGGRFGLQDFSGFSQSCNQFGTVFVITGMIQMVVGVWVTVG